MLCLTAYQLYIFFRLVSRPDTSWEPCGEHRVGLETVHKKFAIAPAILPRHPRLDKLQSMFG